MEDGYRGMRDEVLALRKALDRMGVEHEDTNEITSFLNSDGECTVFPSVQLEGELFVTFTVSDYVATAEDAIRLCRVRGADDGE